MGSDAPAFRPQAVGRHRRRPGLRGARPIGRASGSFVALVLLAVAALLAPAAPAAAQQTPVYLSVSPEEGELQIQIGDLFDEEGGLTDALHSGLPIRILLVAELWKDGFFDSQRGRAEWRASVVFDPLEQHYHVATGSDGGEELAVDSLDAVRDALQRSFALPIRPPEEGRYYYLGQVVVETLSLSDLEELQRWLRGELAPAVAGDEEVGNAMGRGVRRILVRMLGLPARRFSVRTPVFEYGPRDPR